MSADAWMSEFERRIIRAIRGLLLLAAGTLLVYTCAYYRASPEATDPWIEVAVVWTFFGVGAIFGGLCDLYLALRRRNLP